LDILFFSALYTAEQSPEICVFGGITGNWKLENTDIKLVKVCYIRMHS